MGASGRALWRAVLADLPADLELTATELAILEAGCRQLDLNVRLEELLDRDGLIVVGSQDQPRLTAVTTELRQGRLALERLLSSLRLRGDE